MCASIELWTWLASINSNIFSILNNPLYHALADWAKTVGVEEGVKLAQERLFLGRRVFTTW